MKSPALWILAILLSADANAQLRDEITVTASRSRTRVAETPASVVVLSDDALEATAAPTLDDALRQVAGFTLFRRSGSRVANPTAQGVTLRGVGASGASRALVLDDGIPMNDPFGGWVFWGRVPVIALDRVEVMRGGASDLYGSSAMGGVVQFIRRSEPAIHVDVSAGDRETGAAAVLLSEKLGAWNATFAGDFFTSAGYVAVRPEERGAVDVAANAEHLSLDATLRTGRGFVRGSFYREERENGTPLQNNETDFRQVAGGGDLALAGGSLALRGYASEQDYAQTFSAIAEDRASERLTVDQSVPSNGVGGNVQWTRAAAGRHVVIAGVDLRSASGVSEERRFTPAGIFDAEASGTQRIGAIYLEDVWSVSSRFNVTAGIRADAWRNRGEGETRSEQRIDPRVSLLWRASEGISISASAYRAFRAPTLNELYRGFRVGNIQTSPNAQLGPETLDGLELGIRAANARLTLFSMDVRDTIANVTIGETKGTILRLRQNLGATRSRGAELEGEWRLGSAFHASASWMFVDATVRDGDLRGRRVPQVPRNQATAQILYSASATIGLQMRWSAAQFDDDRNELPLDSYFVADASASYPISPLLSATLAVENIFDREVEVSATPVVTLGQPRAWRAGLRWRSGSR